MTLNVQSILNDKVKRAVFEELSRNDISLEDLIERSHLPARSVESAVRAMASDDMIGGPDNMLFLTEQGKRMVGQLRSIEKEGSGLGTIGSARPSANKMTGKESRQRSEDRGT